MEPLALRLEQFRDGGPGIATLDAAAEIAGLLQTYMLVRFAMSVLTELGFWAVTATFGLDLSREWGVIAFVLNFIPFIGSFIATLLPALFAGAQYGSLSLTVWVFIALNIVQFIVGSYIEPRVAAAAVSISPFIVLFAVFLGVFVGHRRRLYPLSACRS